MITYFILTLWCLTCNPVQIYQLDEIPVFDNPSSTWADLYCKQYGDILSGDYRRRNMGDGTVEGQIAATNDWIVYSCTRISSEF